MIDVPDRIKSLTNNYKITKKENLPSFVDLCKELKINPSSQKETIRSMRLECTKVLNSTVKKNIFREFLALDGLSILSDWITNCSEQVDETLLKELVSIIKDKLNDCGGLNVAIIKKSKIGKILNALSKSTNFSKTIKTSVDDLIQDWKQKFVQESADSSSPTIPKKKSTTSTPSTIPSTTSTPNGEKRKRNDDQSGSPQQDENSNHSNTISIETMPKKKVKSSEDSLKKKRVSWSNELEKVKFIEPRQAYVEDVYHKSVQELMNEEMSKERILLTQQRQMKQLILANMKNTVGFVTPLRALLPTDKPSPLEINSNEAKIISDMVKTSPSINVTESPSSPVPLPSDSTLTNLLNIIGLPTPGLSVAVGGSSPVVNNPSPSNRLNITQSNNPIQSPQMGQQHNPYSIQTPIPPSNNYSNYPPPPSQQPYHHHQQPSPYQRSQQPPPMNYQPHNRPPPQQHQQQHYAQNYQNNGGGQKNKPPPINSSPYAANSASGSNKQQSSSMPVSANTGEPRSFKPIKCLYYTKGQCKHGTKCAFYHEGFDKPTDGIEEYNFEKAKFFQSLKSGINVPSRDKKR